MASAVKFGAYNAGIGYYKNDRSFSINPVMHPSLGVFRLHAGDDWSTGRTTGIDVRAAAGGVVVINDRSDSFGNMLVIEHTRADGSKFRTLYAHMKNPSPYAVGLSLGAGAVIGEAGATGDGVVGIHLHFEIIDGGGTTILGKGVGRLDPASFTNWGGLSSSIGVDLFGNSITLQKSTVNGVTTETIYTVDRSGAVIGTFFSSLSDVKDGAGNVIGYSIVADGTAAPNTCGYTVIENRVMLDGTLASQTFYGAGTTTTYQSGITITTDIATGVKTAQVPGAGAPIEIAADGTITGTSAGKTFTITLPADPLGDTKISLGGHAFTAHAGSLIDVNGGGVNISGGMPVPVFKASPTTLLDVMGIIPQKYVGTANTVWDYSNGVMVEQYTQNYGAHSAGDIVWSIPGGPKGVSITIFFEPPCHVAPVLS